jgi:sulfur-oxidizing protein SoxZ
MGTDGRTTVRILMSHEMESGQRKEANGRLVPAWHIQTVTVKLNDRPVLSAHWGPSVSKNPFLQFNLRGAKPGDRLAVAWTDNRGTSRGDEAIVAG